MLTGRKRLPSWFSVAAIRCSRAAMRCACWVVAPVNMMRAVSVRICCQRYVGGKPPNCCADTFCSEKRKATATASRIFISKRYASCKKYARMQRRLTLAAMTGMLLIALAAAPGLAICLYVFSRDVHNPEPKRFVVLSFLLGALLTVPAYYAEKTISGLVPRNVTGILLQAFFAIAVVEEGLKFLALRYYCFRLSSFDEPLDGIVYSIMVSMGFATVENVAYVAGHGYSVLLARTFTSVPAHACFAAIMGYYAGLAQANPSQKGPLFRRGLLRAILFHG
ncbi:MAG: PrsW family intramembrane metalloprotease, partial [Chitinophagaceae bacterium]